MVRLWWNLLNRAVFDDKLPKVADIALVQHRKEYAWAIPHDKGRIKLTIQPRFDTRRLFLMVLIHEMVHAWEHYKDFDMSHGQKFLKWKNKIKTATNLDLKEFPDV